MKKVTAIVLIVFLAVSCAMLKDVPSYSLLNKIDFRKYSDAGFLFTPEMYPGEYKSVGIIDFIKMPNALFTVEKELPDKDKYTPKNPSLKTTTQWYTEKVDLQEAVEELYQQCSSLGADALVNFKVDFNTDKYINVGNPIDIIGYRITGFAIKRINN